MKQSNFTFRPILALAAGLLPLVGAATVLPLGAARPALAAAAQQQEKPAPAEPASTSRLTGIALPGGALRLTDAAMAGELTALLKAMAAEEGFALGQTEALLWGGSGHDDARNRTLQSALARTLQEAAYNYQVVGDKDIKDGRATVFMAGKTGTGKAALGLFVARDDFFMVAWGWITRKNAAPQEGAQGDAKAAPAADQQPSSGKGAAGGGGVPAELVGGTWSWTTISGVGYRDTITKRLAEPSGMSARFTFLPGGRYAYFWYMRQRTYNLVTEATSTHEGRVTFNGDGTFTLHPAKGHYKGSTGSRLIDRPMTEAEKKPMDFVYEWRNEDGKRQLYMGPSKSSLSRFKRGD
jgi:hypothetical protein